MLTIHGWDITQQMIVVGIGRGLAYGVLAAGIVLVYRASGVINFAQGAFGAFGIGLMAVLVGKYHMPFPLAFLLVGLGTLLLGGLVEFSVVRRLFLAPRLVLFLATLGMAQLIQFGITALPDVPADATGGFPTMVDWTWNLGSRLTLQGRDISVMVIVPLLVLVLVGFLRTPYGLMIRASASNGDKSRLVGIRVRRTSTMVWAAAAAFSGMTAVLLAPLQNLSLAGANQIDAGGFALLLRALLVALIARMRSLPATIAGGIAVGLGEVVLQRNVNPTDLTVVDLWLFAATLLCVYMLRKAGAKGDDSTWKIAPKVKPLPENVKSVWWMHHLPTIGLCALLLGLAIVPIFASRPSQAFLWTRVLIFAIAGCSLTVLTGWAGQLSLGQFAFAAIGGIVTMTMVTNGEIPVPFAAFDLRWHAPWAVAVVLSVAVGVAVAVLIGIPALRIPGLYLAVITLALAVLTGEWIVSRPVFAPNAGIIPSLPKPKLGPVDFSSRISYYYLCLVFLIGCLALVSQLRRTGIGRTIVAVRTNEQSASAMTVSSTRMKLIAFGISGGMASLSGSLLITLLPANNPATTFAAEESIRTVAVAIIGGLGTIAGPLVGSLWVIGIPAILGGSAATALFTSSIGLLVLLMYFPGGLIQVGYALRDALARRVASKLPAATGPQRSSTATVPAQIHRSDPPPAELGTWLAASNVTVRFGGRVAVDDVSITVAPRELVGLIGTNGAGKSTLMNAISGFVPATGDIEVLGTNISRLPSYQRHRVGLGRGFQTARLFEDLTVRETVLIALEARERSLLLPSCFGLPPSGASERRKRVEADEIIAYVGLGRYGDEFISTLSTGTRRITELACQLAIGARVLLLDEPTAGLAQRETEAFGPLIKQIQRELDAAVLLIEHDMPLVMSISDRVYCLEAGVIIAQGTPAEVRYDPRVIASYLGTDERSIQRSNAPSPSASEASEASEGAPV